MRFLGLILLLVMSLQASEEIVNREYSPGTAIRIIASIDAMPRSGFLPVRVEMENKGSKAIAWTISTEVEQYPDYRRRDVAKINAEFRVECPAGDSKVTELLVPIHRAKLDQYSDSMTQSISWTVRTNSYPDLDGRGYYEGADHAGTHKLAFSQSLAGDFQTALQTAWKTKVWKRRSSGRYGRGGNAEPYEHRFDSSILFENWRAYAGMDALIFAREDYLKTTPGVKAALSQWVQSGGHLIVLNRESAVPTPDFSKGVSHEGFGSRQILECGENFDEGDAKVALEYLDSQAPYQATDFRSHRVERKEGLLTSELGVRSLQTNLILIALIIFGVVVGPVNLFKWADKTRRHRLFFTTPLISLVTSVLLIGFMVLRDGFGGDGVRAIALDVGGPGENSAAILQEQFSRTGILLSSSFALDKHSVMSSLPAPVTDYNMADSKSAKGMVSYTAKVTEEGWDFSGDWFESRTEQSQALRSVIPSREKLELISSVDGAPRLVSSFSYPLENVYYRDENDAVWSARSISPGETVTLSPSQSAEQLDVAENLIKRFNGEHRHTLTGMVERRGSFSAQAVGAPVIASYEAVDWQESPVLITGLLK